MGHPLDSVNFTLYDLCYVTAKLELQDINYNTTVQSVMMAKVDITVVSRVALAQFSQAPPLLPQKKLSPWVASLELCVPQREQVPP